MIVGYINIRVIPAIGIPSVWKACFVGSLDHTNYATKRHQMALLGRSNIFNYDPGISKIFKHFEYPSLV